MGNSISEPTGTWKSSAESYDLNSRTNVLTANLKSRDGSIKQSSVIVTHNMELDNNDGQFKIGSRGQYTYPDTYSQVLPAGNWMLSAKCITFQNGILSALLQNPNGSFSHSTMVVLNGHVVENDCGKFKITNIDHTQLSPTTGLPLQCPLGSWINSAEDVHISMEGHQYILKATLTAADGSKRQRSIKYSSQYDMFDNRDGEFVSAGNCKHKFK